MSTADVVVITGRPRRAPAAPGTGIPADEHEAYRRGICRDCKTAWHAAGQPRCDSCHEEYVRSGRPTVFTPARHTGRTAA
jgi:hypothetical protein